jgi:hypothetical protein
MLVDFWAKVRTKHTIFFADVLYKLSCPFNEKALVETGLFFSTTSQLCLFALNVLMTFV